MNYSISVRIPLGPLYEGVKDFQDSINSSLAGFGVNEKIVVTSVIPLTLTVACKLSDEAKSEISNIIVSQFKEKYGFAEIESFKLEEDGHEEETSKP